MAKDSIEGFEGKTVRDRDGGKIGTIKEVYLDEVTDRPKWGVVKTGPLGKRRFIPLAEAKVHDGDIALPVSEDRVGDAPDVGEHEHLSPGLESRLERHYGLGGSGKRDDSSGEEARSSVSQGAMAAARTRQREEFGGFHLGAVLLGWLVAGGVAVLLTAILSAAGGAVGLTEVSESQAKSNAETVSLVGGIVLLVVLALAYYLGGYNAGRLSRFDGARQGLGVWIVGLLITVLLGAAGAIFGSKYNVLAKLDLPRIPIDEGTLATGGLIALVAIVVLTLLAAVAGGKAGERYHKKVDRAAYGG